MIFLILERKFILVTVFVLQKSTDTREDSMLPFGTQLSIDKQIEKFEKIIKATEKRNARIKELVDTEVS